MWRGQPREALVAPARRVRPSRNNREAAAGRGLGGSHLSRRLKPAGRGRRVPRPAHRGAAGGRRGTGRAGSRLSDAFLSLVVIIFIFPPRG